MRRFGSVPGWRVLAINLNHYVYQWWDTCDADRADTVSMIANACGQLLRWLAQFAGDEIFYSPRMNP